jgi:1-acyl-sn-glycerol-3-phosphate acyltransferase
MPVGPTTPATPLPPRLPPGPIRGTFTFALIALNTVLCCIPLFAVALLKLLVPVTGWRRLTSRWLVGIAQLWIANNTAMLRATQSTRWDVEGVEGLDPEQWYLVVSNHRSWVDIFALQAVFNRRIPFLKFFLKQQLIFVPLMGFAWWALDMPFMKRHSRAYLERYPEKRGQDLETTRRACEKFRLIPTSVINFVEGTRYTLAKHARHSPPYRHLLQPRAGGIAFVLGTMGALFHSLLDVTVAYPKGSGGMWDLCCGRVPEIVIRVRLRGIEPWLVAGDYANDPEFRDRFQQWLAALWTDKDRLLDDLLAPDDTPARA